MRLTSRSMPDSERLGDLENGAAKTNEETLLPSPLTVEVNPNEKEPRSSFLQRQLRNVTPQVKQQAAPKHSITEMVVLSMIFLISGPLLIMSNKYILRDLDFEFPLTLTLVTLVFCSAVTWAYVHSKGTTLRHSHMITREFFIYRICPIGALSAGSAENSTSISLFKGLIKEIFV